MYKQTINKSQMNRVKYTVLEWSMSGCGALSREQIKTAPVRALRSIKWWAEIQLTNYYTVTTTMTHSSLSLWHIWKFSFTYGELWLASQKHVMLLTGASWLQYCAWQLKVGF